MAFETRTLSVLSYGFVMVLIGVPVWWHSTDVVRYPLPFDDIQVISQTEVKQLVQVTIVSHNSAAKTPPACVQGSAIFTFELSTRVPSEREESILTNAKSMEELDSRLSQASPAVEAGHIVAYDTKLVSKGEVVFGQFRAAFFSSDDTGGCDLVNAVRQTALGEKEVEQMMQSIVAPRHEDKSEDSRLWSQVKVTAAPELDLLLSLLVPEPHLRPVGWNIEADIRHHFQPFLDQISHIYAFDVKSQVLYLTSLGLSATQLMTDSKTGQTGHAIRQEDLGLAINMESKLSSHVSSKPILNFLAYVPTEAQSPLHIKAGDEGTFLATNAFVVPRWGGVSIWNMDGGEENTNNTRQIIDGRRFMSVVTTQLRSLLGLKQRRTGRAVLSDWEKDFLLRMRLFENMMTSRVTLSSLADLLSKISNIVITQEVADKVVTATNAYNIALMCLKKGNVASCFEHSRVSFTSSEEVFFDNSLLALLYFPEDQKYAIYVPLFLPILFSFITVLVPVAKELKQHLFPNLSKEKQQ